MKKHTSFKEWLFFVPAAVIAAGAFWGFQKNIPVFPSLPKLETKVEAETGTEETDLAGIAARARDRESNLPKNQKKKQKKKPAYHTGSAWKDGNYTGSGTGYGGTIRVCVSIKKGKIADIRVLSHDRETPAYFAKASTLTKSIVSAQSLEINAVSGATYSSGGILEAVADALIKAGDASLKKTKKARKNKPAVSKADASKAQKTSLKNKTQRAEKTKGQPADGEFEGSAVCERFGYNIHLKTRFRNGKTVAVYALSVAGNSDPTNTVYLQKAWKPVIRNILKAQKADVDAVTGATYSSYGIMEAYADAYEKAVFKNFPKTVQSAKPSKKPKETRKPEKTETIITPQTEQKELPENGLSDGTYHVSTVCEPDEDEDFYAYTLSADVIFQDQKCKDILNFSSNAESNRLFYQKAANGNGSIAGVVKQLLQKQSADGIHAVTGATCSSRAIIHLYLQALERAGAESRQKTDLQTPVPETPLLETPVPVPVFETPVPQNQVLQTPLPSPEKERKDR